MPKRKSRKKKKGIKRPYKLDKLSRARHRHRKRRHAASQEPQPVIEIDGVPSWHPLASILPKHREIPLLPP